MFFLKKVVKEKRDLKKIVIEQFWYIQETYFTVYAHINETLTAETPIQCILLREWIAIGL